MLVHEVMSTEPVTVRADTTLKAALTALADHRLTLLPVVDGAGHVCGVVSEADLIRELVSPDPRVREIPHETTGLPTPAVVEEVMTPHAVTVLPDSDLAEAVELLTSTVVKSLPVVDRRGRLVGMVSRSDVVRVLARGDDTLGREVVELLRSLDLGDWLVEVRDGVVDVTGPEDAANRSLARAVAATVPGVVDVRTS